MAPRNQIDTLVILGAAGDLTSRLLLPGLATLLASGRGRTITLIGSAREPLTDKQWKQVVRKSFAQAGVHGKHVEQTLANTRYIQADVTTVEGLQSLLDASKGSPAFFFALPPAVTALACAQLATMQVPKTLKLVLEKPFGTDSRSAAELNRILVKIVPEEQIHRVDHFLGRSDVLNIFGVRFSNLVIEQLLSNQNVEKIEIIYDEDLALEGRAGYYDHAGALRDMIQSHLLQIMALLMMEPPASLKEFDVRNGKAMVLDATRIWGGDPVASSKRARYTAGKIGRRKIPAYTREPGVDPARETETLAQMTVEVANWRWAGVPVTLRSGKAMGKPRKEAVITFKPVPHLPAEFTTPATPDVLRIGFKPAGMSLDIDVNGPGDKFTLQKASLTADFGPGQLEAYGEVLAGVLDGDAMLAVRGDTAVRCWLIVEPVLRAWAAGKVPMQTYPAGSEGPRSWLS